jgi:hypothetical protein
MAMLALPIPFISVIGVFAPVFSRPVWQRTDCEFSVAQKLRALGRMEANSGIREWCGQKNAWHSVTDVGRECA